MKMASLSTLIDERITGEWGQEPTSSAVKVIRTTNFTNEGRLDLTKIVERNIDPKKVKKKALQKGDIIIEKSGGGPTQPVGRVVYFDVESDEKFLCNNFTTILRPKKEIVDSRYLLSQMHFLHKTGRTRKYQNKTTGIHNLNLDKYLQERIPLPPLPEQRHIAQLLSQAEQLIARRQESLRLLDAYLKSTFLEMFGDPASNKHGWQKFTIRELASKFSDGPFGSNLKSEHYSTSGIQVIRLQNIGINHFIEKDISYVNINHYENALKKYSCYPDDVVIATMGVPNIRACVVPKHIKVAINKADCVLFRVNQTLSNPHYISHLLNMEGFLFLAASFIHGQTRARISSGQIASIKIPVPPLSLQTQFAQIVTETEVLKTQYQQSLAALEQLYGSLSQRAFRGELTNLS